METGSRTDSREKSGISRILVVEDERIVARDLCKTLEDLGYLVGPAARSAEEALAQAAVQAPDLVLMDVRIKGQTDGIDAAAALKQLHKVPVVFLTASMDEGTLQRAFRAQPEGYLPKPFTKESLRTAIEVALKRHEVESRLREANLHLSAQKAELEKRTTELAVLSEMGDLLQLCDSVDEVLGTLGRFGRQLFPEEEGALYLTDGSGTHLGLGASWGQRSPIPIFDLEACRALRKGRVHRVLPPEDQLRCSHVERSPDVASIGIPMTTNGISSGVLSLTFPAGPNLDPSGVKLKEQLATVVSQRVSLTLTNLRIREQLKRESILDPLTGLTNRRYLASAFERELRLALRTQRNVGLLLFDVDHFKRVNDQFGHGAADQVLCEVASLLRSRLRAYDVSARYGGDELVVLLPDTAAEGALLVAEQLRQSIRDLRIVHGGGTLPPVTISMGVAIFPTHGSNAESLFRAADGALYTAKRDGRDRVAVAVAGEDEAPLAGEPSGTPRSTL